MACDIIEECIYYHNIETIKGNSDDNLSFYDILYPVLENIFGIDNCFLGVNCDLKEYYSENYDGMSYDDFVSLINIENELFSKIKDEKAKFDYLTILEEKVQSNIIKKELDMPELDLNCLLNAA